LDDQEIGVIFAAGLQGFLSSSHSHEVHTAFIPAGIRGTIPGRWYVLLGMKATKIVFEKLVLIFLIIFSLLLRAKNHYSVILQAKPFP
jgi:hypothetical protein